MLQDLKTDTRMVLLKVKDEQSIRLSICKIYAEVGHLASVPSLIACAPRRRYNWEMLAQHRGDIVGHTVVEVTPVSSTPLVADGHIASVVSVQRAARMEMCFRNSSSHTASHDSEGAAWHARARALIFPHCIRISDTPK